MATNLEYLESKIAEQEALIKQYQANISSYNSNINNWSKQIIQLKIEYANTGALQIKKRKEILAKIDQLNLLIADAKAKIGINQTAIATAQSEIASIQTKIDKYLQAVNTGVSSGMDDKEAQDFGNNAISGDVAAMQAQDQASAQTDANKKTIRIVLIVLLLLIVAGLIWYFVKKGKKAKKD